MLSLPFGAVDLGGAAPLVRLGWTVVVGLVTALGVASAVLFLPTDVLIAAIGDGLLVAVVVVGLRQAALTDTRDGERARPAGAVAAIFSAGALGAVASAGLVRLFGPAALAVPVVVVVTYLLYVGSTTHDLAPSHGAAQVPADLGDLSGLSAVDLCTVWNDTLSSVQRARSVDELAGLCDLRRSVLDELERRDPQAVCRWLQRHPRASSAPF